MLHNCAQDNKIQKKQIIIILFPFAEFTGMTKNILVFLQTNQH